MLFFLLSLFFTGAGAQENNSPRLNGIIENLDSLVARYGDHTLFGKSINPQTAVASMLEMVSEEEEQVGISPEVELIEAERKKLRSDLGFSLDGRYTENLEGGFFDKADTFFPRRMSLGLEWELLNNGFFENRNRAERLDKDKESIEAQVSRDELARRQRELGQRINNHFRSRKIDLLNTYLEVLKEREQVLIELYYLKYVSWDRVLELTSQKAQTENQLNALISSAEQYNNLKKIELSVARLPVFNFDLHSLIEDGHHLTQLDSVALVAQENLNVDYSPLNEISLSTSFEYNFFYDSTGDPITGGGFAANSNREFFSFDVDLSIPIPFQQSRNKKIADARRKIFQKKISETRSDHQQTIRTIYNTHQELLDIYFERFNEYQLQERHIHLEMAKKNFMEEAYSSRNLFKLISDRYYQAIQIVEAQQQLYLNMLELYPYLRKVPVSDWLIPVAKHVSDTDRPLNPSDVGVYIWSDTFEEYSANKLVTYLKHNRYQRAYLSLGPDSVELGKARDLISDLKNNGIETELMIGNNLLFLPRNRYLIDTLVARAYNLGAAGIHLDVEPHTFDDWEARESYYQQQYVKMLEYADKICEKHNIRLSVSIPVYYDSIIGVINRYADGVNVMAYQLNSVEKIREKLSEEMDIFGSKMSIALRTEDFKTLSDLNLFMEILSSELYTNNFTIHELNELINVRLN